MDLLFKRYASPFLLVDGYIQTGRFEFFVNEFIRTLNEEKEEKSNWEFFLHKIWDKSYKDFKESLTVDRETVEMSEKTMEATVLNSLNILGGFNPTQKEG